jgi:hypothetical protein
VDVLSSTRQKTEAILDRIRALQAGEFPQPDAKAALEAMEQIFTEHRDRIIDLERGGAPTAAPDYCSNVVQDLFGYLPVLGFLHRSKNASNAFEVYGPLLRLARQVISTETRLVLSSEWDFSPYTLLRMPGLPSFVLLGLPASESRTVLLTPLAGHEFGHSIWALEDGKRRYESALAHLVVERIRVRLKEYSEHFLGIAEETLMTDLFAMQTWLPAARSALRQCEEVFCDLVGLRLFGEAYLHAFAYLIAPGTAGERPSIYPSVPQRVDYLMRAARRFGISVPAGYADLFLKLAPARESAGVFLQSIADETVGQHVDVLMHHVETYADTRGVGLPVSSEIEEIYRAFENFVPAAQPATLSAIVNAGWRAAHVPTLWEDYPQVRARRQVVLNELMLKTAQVLEYRARLREQP